MDLVPVRARDCECPGTPHTEEGDIVFLLPKPSLALGLQTQVDLAHARDTKGEIDTADLQARWLVTYCRHAAVGWNLTDAAGKPVPFDVEALLADYTFAYVVADKADDLYREAILRPLGLRPSGNSRNGQTGDSISPTPRSRRKSPAQSSPVGSAVTPR